MIIKCIPGGIFIENCYIIGDEDTNEAMLVDPGEQIAEISEEIEKSGLEVKKIVNTHTHLDHVAGVEAFKKMLSIPFYIHKKEQPVLDLLPEAKMRFPGFDFVEVPEVDGYVKEGETLSVGNLKRRDTPCSGTHLGTYMFCFRRIDNSWGHCFRWKRRQGGSYRGNDHDGACRVDPLRDS